MTRPLARTRLQDLGHMQIGALLAMHQGPLRSTPRGWYAIRAGVRINLRTWRTLTDLGLVTTQANATIGVLTASGQRLADLAVTLSRQIAAGVAEHAAIASEAARLRTLLPHVDSAAVPIDPEPMRLSTRRTPRDAITAQLRTAAMREQPERSEGVANRAKTVAA